MRSSRVSGNTCFASPTFKLAWEPPNTKPEYFTLINGKCGPLSYAVLNFTLTLTTIQYTQRAPKGMLLQVHNTPSNLTNFVISQQHSFPVHTICFKQYSCSFQHFCLFVCFLSNNRLVYFFCRTGTSFWEIQDAPLWLHHLRFTGKGGIVTDPAGRSL